ncbi:LytR DNA-binding transcription regulator [Corynebacterium resistens DSM 45100]|uniref:LytR DNA-binding transcription regulator n=1 Tax=Corynebacterium resistens (strain DSM 45100 / JCM 12819 / GTC 2026 / SICGH 158) TaxID=662755 RepID=F8E1D6_CORRG|nr:LCP family protein [Corynebacterium resistens]AEI10088.1 LytR DNA-binding transcription regulator [Corynebacterium resistens DSM 45100]
MNHDNRPRRSRHIQAAPTGPEARQIGPRPARGVLAAVSAALLAFTGVGYATIGNLNDDLAEANNLDLGNSPDGATDILLVGVDSRTDAKGNPLSQREIDMLRAGEEQATNTDTMILIRVPNDGSSATAVSLPRDTYVKTPDQGNMKLNGVYGTAKFEKQQALEQGGESDKSKIDRDSTEAGRKALISTVADLTGITVDHYAEIGLLGFVLLTDAVGGVDVCLNKAVDEPLSGAKFPKGQQRLSGPDALSFVRQRHELPRGDLDRITRQQAYMASLTSQILSSKTLTNPSAISKINNAVQRSVVLDEGWDVMGLATQMQNLSGGNVKFQTIPVTSIDGTGDNGESIVTVNTKKVHGFFDDLLGSKEENQPEKTEEKKALTDYKPEDYTVSVSNASEIGGLAGRVSKLTTDYGYKKGKVGNSPQAGVSESQVNAKDENDPAARALAKQLGGLKVVEDPSLGDKELSVTLSGTYSGPGVIDGSAELLKPDDPNVGTLTPGMKDLDGDGIPDGDSNSGTATDGSSNGKNSGDDSKVVGQEGTVGLGEKDKKPIDAGGDGPMCVN